MTEPQQPDLPFSIEKVIVSSEGKRKLIGKWKIKECKYLNKKIKRRIFYEISWWGAESRYTKCFYSAKKMRNFVNELHSWYNEGFIEIEKTWGYREYSPRHKWFYVSYRPNHFLLVERY